MAQSNIIVLGAFTWTLQFDLNGQEVHLKHKMKPSSINKDLRVIKNKNPGIILFLLFISSLEPSAARLVFMLRRQYSPNVRSRLAVQSALRDILAA